MAQPDATQEPEPEEPGTVIVVRSIGPVSDGEPLFCQDCGTTLVLQMLPDESVIGVCLPCHGRATSAPWALVRGLISCRACQAVCSHAEAGALP